MRMTCAICLLVGLVLPVAGAAQDRAEGTNGLTQAFAASHPSAQKLAWAEALLSRQEALSGREFDAAFRKAAQLTARRAGFASASSTLNLWTANGM
jgi:hypothetical protein